MFNLVVAALGIAFAAAIVAPAGLAALAALARVSAILGGVG
jgi:hypothetical protein